MVDLLVSRCMVGRLGDLQQLKVRKYLKQLAEAAETRNYILIVKFLSSNSKFIYHALFIDPPWGGPNYKSKTKLK